jgi:hypothetical protein
MAQFDGRPGALPITAYYKGAFGMVFNFTSGGTAYPLTGAGAAFVIYEKNGTAALTLSGGSGLTINEAGGSITLGITNAQMVALATQEYNYEFILTLSGGNVWPVLDSVFNVSENGQASYSGDTVTVALDGNSISLTILPAAGDVGSGGGVNDGDTLATGLTFPNTGLHILDTNATHDLIITPGSNLTADRTLTVTTGDADRTLTLSGNTTLSGGTHSGTNTGDQTITLSGDVSGSGTGAITATISALDAAKIADGTVSNTEFQYLNGVTGGVQGQIDGKAATSHTHAISDVTSLQTALDGKVDENAPITGATKTKITYAANGLVTAGADATTADIADSSNKRYVTDAQLTVIGNTSGTNTGDQTSVTGNAGTVTVADAAADTTTWVLLGRSQTGSLSPATDAGLTYNASTNALTATTFVGALNGNADTVTGFSGTHSGTSSGTNTGDQDLSVLQPKDATLTALAALTIAADTLTIGTGADAFSQTSFAANTFPAKASTGSLVAKTITDFGLSLVDDATASDARTTLGLGSLATQSGTFSGTSSGTNTGDQSLFSTIAVSGQSNVSADSTGDTLTLVAGTNVTITTDASTDSITINATGGGSGDVATDTIWDAKGDLAVGTGANNAAKLTVGANGKQIYADSGESTGLRWGPDVISPSQITSDQDDYAPTGWADAQIVRLDGDNGIRAITSMAAGYSGEIKQLINVGSYPIYFPGQHPDGTAANRIDASTDFILFPKLSARIMYDGTSSRWRILDAERSRSIGKVVYYQQSPGSITAGDHNTFTWGGTTGSVSASAPSSPRPGRYSLTTSTSSTGDAWAGFSKLSSNEFTAFGDAHIWADFHCWLDDLSDGTETYTATWSISSAMNTAGAANNTVGIRYSHGTNSGKFQGFSRDNAGSETPVDLGITVAADTLYSLRVEIDKAKAEARFYIDGVMCGRVAANMPNAVSAGTGCSILKSAGTTSRALSLFNISSGAIYP